MPERWHQSSTIATSSLPNSGSFSGTSAILPRRILDTLRMFALAVRWNIIRSIRQGRENDPDFFTRMRGSGPWAELIAKRFAIACRRLGLNKERIVLRTDLFRAPEGAQMRLF